MMAIFKGDGRGNVVAYPLGTMVNCNQVGHNYCAHKITEYCLVTAPAPWCEVCNGYVCRRYLHQRRR
jgi:hypothetical protein